MYVAPWGMRWNWRGIPPETVVFTHSPSEVILFGAELAVIGILGAAFGTDPLHPYDVRNATPESIASLRAQVPGLVASRGLPELPQDPVERLVLQERFVRALEAPPRPGDSCGWYRFGWDTHEGLMARILQDVGLGEAMALALDHADGPELMRLSGIPQNKIQCNRFWFGFRDANTALATATREAFGQE